MCLCKKKKRASKRQQKHKKELKRTQHTRRRADDVTEVDEMHAMAQLADRLGHIHALGLWEGGR